MAGSRVIGPKLLRQLNRSAAAIQIRSLHMTYTATAPRMPTADKHALPMIPGEAQASVSKASNSPATRTFNTSRALKAVNDSSTIDFAYLPKFELRDLDHDIESQAPSWQIPILPSATHRYDTPDDKSHEMAVLRQRRDAMETSPEARDEAASGPVISTAACASTHISEPSAMSDVHDGAEHHTTDFHDVVKTVSQGSTRVSETMKAVSDAARQITLGLEREGEDLKQSKGLLKQVWTGLLDDIMGGSKVQTPKSS